MAQKVQVILVDDLEGGPADETVSFSLDGVSYEIDLNEANASKLRDALSKYIAAARKVGGRGSARGRGRSSRKTSAKTGEIRAWAKSKGLEVNERGRIPASIVEEYEKAHS
ncbi:Lsr2 family protein [Carbonactinospora thermoautotrophica]|uniref:Putative Lsr2-like protein n=1 Tax=Carbonactinospora thermoautotrophica TaxID=1469144 RepID=A0A132MM16_9ACTN|nr:Lsr2 family protein [Carbonactinospora thermoautotrophica]KWW97564.1 hypothetical protein TH66_18445 [Carbonactinospora thermoautotrophica]KWW98907.1 putative Lsr2-like protein [Carbonactinospora thermoautotrophica]KWX07627.1 hypothetical protein TR74_18170 [Carbonactinospora thermoautotrophica]MCX9191486.1 Lsr2 family protein [Carbonactinospora thermoautotrophica]